MQKRVRFIAVILFTSILTATATAALTAPAEPQTHIVTDEKTGAILFVVNGREQARIDATGLHVRESIDYQGTLMDGSNTYNRMDKDTHGHKADHAL